MFNYHSTVWFTVSDSNIATSNVYLICDELDKMVGKYSIKEKGSARGHRGVLSVSEALKTLVSEDIPFYIS